MKPYLQNILNIHALNDLYYKKPSFGNNISALDGVRGLAVIMVILGHTGFLKLQVIGVWLFFCLSAFLLTIPFARNPEIISSPAYIKKYMVRRVKRIIPMYFFILTAYFILQTKDINSYIKHILFVRGDIHFWTIPQEMFFYLVLPIVAAISFFILKGNRWLTIIFLAALATFANFYFTASWFHFKVDDGYRPFYIGLFLSGMIFSYIYTSPQITKLLKNYLTKRLINYLSLLVLVIFFLSAKHLKLTLWDKLPFTPYLTRIMENLYPQTWLYSGTYGVLCAFLIFAAVVCDQLLINKIMSSWFLRAIGIVSFSMYLLHFFVMNLFLSMGIQEGLILCILTFVVTYLLSIITYGLIERPFLHITVTAPKPIEAPAILAQQPVITHNNPGSTESVIFSPVCDTKRSEHD